MPKQHLNSKTKYSCPVAGCKSEFNRPYKLAQHRLFHVNVKPFACSLANCGKAYTSKSHLDRHIRSAHNESELDILYCCPHCMKKYSNRQNLKRHIKVSHIESNKPFTCDECKMQFKKKEQLIGHMYQHTGIKPFRCSVCSKDFITMNKKRKHMRNHKIHKCEHCDMTFVEWMDLVKHRRVDHASPEYICNDCGKVFKERVHIIRHVKRHLPLANSVMAFFCPYENCYRHYSRNCNLKQHILVTHEGQTFDCSLCGAKLTTKARLNDHIDRHDRLEVILRVPKTNETGRKTRKDENSMKYVTALKLAGIVNNEVETSVDSETINED